MVTPELWTQGHIDPIWDYEYQHLCYRTEPFNDEVTMRTWIKNGHVYQKYVGDLLDMRDSLPNWCIKVGEYFEFTNTGASLYRMRPGTILPVHQDIYVRYKKVHNLPENFTNIYRALVFLDDWRSGHYFEIDSTPIVNWKKGDFVVWRYDVPHMAANIGSENRYTLQITGIQ